MASGSRRSIVVSRDQVEHGEEFETGTSPQHGGVDPSYVANLEAERRRQARQIEELAEKIARMQAAQGVPPRTEPREPREPFVRFEDQEEMEETWPGRRRFDRGTRVVDDSPPPRRYCVDPSEVSLNLKLEIPEFCGGLDPDEFLDWLQTVERVFEYKDLTDDKKVKLVAIRLRKSASVWWDNVNRQRIREGRGRIQTWASMERALRRKYVPSDYRQALYLKVQNLRQRANTVEEYLDEFELLRVKCDLQEVEEQTIARFLAGLRPDIGEVVELQPYETFEDVTRLAVRVERQRKARMARFANRQDRIEAAAGGTEAAASEPRPSPAMAGKQPERSLTKPAIREVGKATEDRGKGRIEPSRSAGAKKCFKCQGLGHFANECPNRRIVTLVEYQSEEEEDGDSAEVIEEDYYKGNEGDLEVVELVGDKGELLMINQVLNVQDLKKNDVAMSMPVSEANSKVLKQPEEVLPSLEEFANLVPSELPVELLPFGLNPCPKGEVKLLNSRTNSFEAEEDDAGAGSGSNNLAGHDEALRGGNEFRRMVAKIYRMTKGKVAKWAKIECNRWKGKIEPSRWLELCRDRARDEATEPAGVG